MISYPRPVEINHSSSYRSQGSLNDLSTDIGLWRECRGKSGKSLGTAAARERISWPLHPEVNRLLALKKFSQDINLWNQQVMDKNEISGAAGRAPASGQPIIRREKWRRNGRSNFVLSWFIGRELNSFGFVSRELPRAVRRRLQVARALFLSSKLERNQRL